MRIMLVSGLSINVKRVRLYNELAVSEVLRLRASAAKALGGRGLNLGVIGAPGLAFAAEAVSISLISSLISSAAENAALAQLEDANRKYEALIDSGTYLNISELSGLEIAEPSAWLGWRDRGRYIHNGDEFISIETDNGALMIRWRDVCAYHAPSPGEFLKKSEVRSMWAVLPAPSITPSKINYHGKLKFGRHPDGTISVRKDDHLIGFPTIEDFKKWAAQQATK